LVANTHIPVSDDEIESVESKLLRLATDGDPDAVQHFADLYQFRRNWQRSRSIENREELMYQAQEAQAWLTDHSR